MSRGSLACGAGALCLLATGVSEAAFTKNIMLTGYWPPSNEMIRHFSANPEQNPDGWAGGNWEGHGYDIHSYFPEFPHGLGQGEGDFEVDYQDTSEDFWRIVEEIHPVAIITFGRGRQGRSWEVEWRQRNLDNWINDYEPPRQPTPSPPDASVPAGHIRYSSLPMQSIVDAVNDAQGQINVNAFIDQTGFTGRFLCEYVAYHGTWYHDLHSDPNDPYWNVAAGHIHVGTNVGTLDARTATEISLRELIGYVDTQIPEPSGVVLLLTLIGTALVQHRSARGRPSTRP